MPWFYPGLLCPTMATAHVGCRNSAHEAPGWHMFPGPGKTHAILLDTSTLLSENGHEMPRLQEWLHLLDETCCTLPTGTLVFMNTVHHFFQCINVCCCTQLIYINMVWYPGVIMISSLVMLPAWTHDTFHPNQCGSMWDSCGTVESAFKAANFRVEFLRQRHLYGGFLRHREAPKLWIVSYYKYL